MATLELRDNNKLKSQVAGEGNNVDKTIQVHLVYFVVLPNPIVEQKPFLA